MFSLVMRTLMIYGLNTFRMYHTVVVMIIIMLFIIANIGLCMPSKDRDQGQGLVKRSAQRSLTKVRLRKGSLSRSISQESISFLPILFFMTIKLFYNVTYLVVKTILRNEITFILVHMYLCP